MNIDYSQRPGERSVRSRRAGAQTPSRTPKRMAPSKSTSPKVSLLSPLFPLLCFALLRFSPPVQRKSRPHSHHKSIKPTSSPTQPLQSMIDQLPSIGKTQWGKVFAADRKEARFRQANASISPIHQPRERRNASYRTSHSSRWNVRQSPRAFWRLSEYQDFKVVVGQTDMISHRTWESRPEAKLFATLSLSRACFDQTNRLRYASAAVRRGLSLLPALNDGEDFSDVFF